jgi:putrescine aminotransferase
MQQLEGTYEDVESDPANYDRKVVLDRYRRHVNAGFARLASLTGLPVEMQSSGTRIWDEEGKEYLDCGGYSVFMHGHAHPVVVEAVKRQLERHPLSTRVLLNPMLALASEALAGITPAGLDCVFFVNSGAEAAEVGLKLGRLNGRTRIISTHNGYHGKTLGALSVTGRAKYQAPFEPLLPVEFVTFGDLDELRAALTHDAERTCVIMEPVQGEAGVVIPPPGYLRGVEQVCRETDAFLIIDEIQTGFGRLGTMWGCDREGVVPDVMLIGKALSGGVMPVGAAVTTARAFEPLNKDPLLHSSTFAGNPLAMAAVYAAISVLKQERLVERAHELGERLLPAIRRLVAEGCPTLVADVRGLGLLIAIEFTAEYYAADFMFELMKRKVLVSHSLNSHKVMRLTPPAILSDADCDWLLKAFREAAEEINRRYAKS